MFSSPRCQMLVNSIMTQQSFFFHLISLSSSLSTLIDVFPWLSLCYMNVYLSLSHSQHCIDSKLKVHVLLVFVPTRACDVIGRLWLNGLHAEEFGFKSRSPLQADNFQSLASGLRLPTSCLDHHLSTWTLAKFSKEDYVEVRGQHESSKMTPQYKHFPTSLTD